MAGTHETAAGSRRNARNAGFAVACALSCHVIAAGCATVTEDTTIYDTWVAPDTLGEVDELDAATDSATDDQEAADSEPDTTPPWDAPDAPDAADSPDAVDAWDATDTADAADAFDAFDAFDGADTYDTYDAADTLDAADAVELCGGIECSPSLSCCSGVCTSTSTDFDNCGSCGAPCNASKANECLGGSCYCEGSPPCSSYSYMRCCPPDGCVATDFNDSHCGGCNRPCSYGTTCSFGGCH